MKKYYFFFILSLLYYWNCSIGQTLQLPDGFAAEMLVDSLNPVGMDIDHHGQVWLIEKHGMVRIVNENGEMLPDPFITLLVDDWNERGLLGIVLHPDFDNEPYVYLYYTVPGVNFNRLSRFTANGELAVPGSEEILLETPVLNGTVHNGGAMVFGNDDKLYLALGDGAKSSNGQDLETIFGKILRLNPDGSIPNDNPFFDVLENDQRAIYAMGVRNPFSMTKSEDGRIFICDVGGGAFEEINELFPGKNYGWKVIEGPVQPGSVPPDEYIDPLFSYSHDDGCAIVGAAVYESEIAVFPDKYHGKFFFADYCNGYIKYLSPEPGSVAEVFASGINRPISLHVAHEVGTLYFLARAGLGGGSQTDNTSSNDGTLWRVFYSGSGAPFISAHPENVLLSVGENAIFEVTAFGTQPIEFQWQINENDVIGANNSFFELSNVQLANNGAAIRCLVSNAAGVDTSEVAILSVTSNKRPVPVIDSPQFGGLFKAGEQIVFSGHATDPEEGDLPSESISWFIVWHHDEHTHPGLGPLTGTSGGVLTVPIINETDPNVWYRIYMTATDSEGLSKTTFRDIYPDLSLIELTGTPGVPINIDGLVREQPFAFESLVGNQRILQAPPNYVTEDTVYIFKNWNNGDTVAMLVFQTPEDGLSIGAMYEVLPLGNGTGLYGEYFNDPELDLDGTPVLTRVDSVIAYAWGAGSPATTIVPEDFFTVRWSGEVQAVFNETYTFYLHSDDGSRLWVGDSLLIDYFEPQPPTEHAGSIVLEAGKRYPIKIEYMEVAGGAEIALSWSSANTPKAIIPQCQLYPVSDRSSVRGEVWLDDNGNDFFDIDEIPLQNVTSLLYRAADTSLVEVSVTEENGSFRFDFLPADTYFLHFLSAPTGIELVPGTSLMSNGQTPLFELEQGEHRVLNVSFKPMPTISAEQAESISGIQIYPNPTEGPTILEMESIHGGKAVFNLQNITGETVMAWNDFIQAGIQKIELDMGNLSKGLYRLEIITEDGYAIKKIVVI